MYRFLLKPKWIAFHLLCALTIVGMVWLSFWQIRRLHQHDAFKAVFFGQFAQFINAFGKSTHLKSHLSLISAQLGGNEESEANASADHALAK